MNPIRRLFRPLHHALQVFFARDLSLRRGEGGVELVLAERDSGGRPVVKPSRSELQQRKDRSELELMQQQLAAVLDEMPETRATLRHLVFVEHALTRKGWRALHKLPLDVLQRALEQLEGLVLNWSPEGLANLRSKMAVAIIDREHMDPDAEADAYRTAMPLDLPVPAVRTDSELVDAGIAADDVGDALAAAYAALGASAPPSTGLTPGLSPALSPALSPPDPTPAELAAVTLAQIQAGAQTGFNAGELLEYHTELGSPSARAQPRTNLAGTGKLAPIKLRELEG